MADWSNTEFGIESAPTTSLVYPPRAPLAIAFVFLLVSAGMYFVSSEIGYVSAVVGAIAGGVTAVLNQKSRSNPNYSELDWFRPALMVIRIALVAAAFGHILRLAIEAAR